MNSIGEKISEVRKTKGLTQEGLAELSKMNLRTIQRIENNESVPRGKTLILICQALGLNSEDFIDMARQENKKSLENKIINFIFLVSVNIILMLIIGYLTLDSQANLNSRIGAFLLSFFIPVFIIYRTPSMTGIERLLKFGTGLIIYIIIALIFVNIGDTIKTGLIPCLLFPWGVLYLGKDLLKLEE